MDIVIVNLLMIANTLRTKMKHPQDRAERLHINETKRNKRKGIKGVHVKPDGTFSSDIEDEPEDS
jgi:hypothetical protein